MWNAGAKPFNQISFGGVPNMSGTLASWMQPMVFNKIVKETVNYEEVETTTDILFAGVWQPLGPAKIKMKPEGQWSWKWMQVHSLTDLNLINDDVIKYRDVQYRVKECSDYAEYGYFEYHLIEDYSGAGPTVEVPDATP